MLLDLVIKNGKIVNADKSIYADVGIRDGIIACIGDAQYFGEARAIIDALGKLVMPGMIDAHVHIAAEQGEFTTKDTVESATIAAAYGGTTSMIQFAIPVADESPLHALEATINATKGNSVIDYSFHGAITRLNDESLNDVKELLTGGIPSIKMFTVYRDAVMLEPLGVLKTLELVGRYHGIANIHAENAPMIESSISQYVSAGLTTPYYHMMSRPPISEVTAVSSLLPVIESTNAPTIFVHMTTSQVSGYIGWAKPRMPVFTEFCPHYLTLTDEVYSRPDGQNFICSPPMRTQEDQDGMWNMIGGDLCDIISSDHSCFSTAQKSIHKNDFSKAPNGLPGIETRGIIMFSEGVAKGRMTENQFVQLLSANSAKLMGMYPQKGIISPGSDADIVIYDPSAAFSLRNSDLHMGTDYTPFEGFKITGRPTHTIVRGNIIIKNGSYISGDFRGEMIKRGSPILY